jgi:hypothetical protein
VPWVISFRPERGDDLVDVRLLTDDELAVDLADRPDQAFLVHARIVGAIQFLQLVFQVGEARLEAKAEPVQDGEVGLVDAVHVAGDRRRHDVRRVAIPDVEHMVRLVFVCADQVAVEWHMVAQQRVGDHALAACKVFARRARLHGWPFDAEFLTIDGTALIIIPATYLEAPHFSPAWPIRSTQC